MLRRPLLTIATALAVVHARPALADQPGTTTDDERQGATAPRAAAPRASVQVSLPAGKRPRRLERLVEGDEESDWVTVCEAPCVAEVSRDDSLRVSGDGIRTSRPVHISEHATHVRLEVDEAHTAPFVLGIVSTGVGGLSTLIGLTVLALPQMGHQSADDPAAQRERREARTVAAGFMIAGAVGLGVGIPLLTANARSTVTTTSLSQQRVSLGRGLFLGPAGIEF